MSGGVFKKYGHASEAKVAKFAFCLMDLRNHRGNCKRINREEWKICLPEPYKYLSHNNCIPCYKGGRALVKSLEALSEQFYRAAAAEERASNTVLLV